MNAGLGRAFRGGGRFDLSAVLHHARRTFRCGPHTVHGPDHWRRVFRNAHLIARHSGADLDVVELFALLHDVCREDDGGDPHHGLRSSRLVESIQGTLFHLGEEALSKLVDACRDHAAGGVTNDATIGACWDADRLDLGRVGTCPDPAFMSTSKGRELARAGTLAFEPTIELNWPGD